MAGTAVAAPTQEKAAATMEAAQAAPAVASAVQATQAAQGTVDPRAQVTAAQQTASSVGNLTAAQGNATLIDNPVQRNIQAGELISGAAADAATAAQFTEQVQAAEATPSTQATVQGQLANLTANFDAANPPAWAAGAMRNATAQMAQRGLGASSLAGQAIVQATLEAALPIAQADAATRAQFEAQNLSNRQQRAMLAAQQRATFLGQEFDQAFQARVTNAAKISDIANMNFTAEQQVQLENSRAANTMNLNNLSNRQAIVMAEAAALAQLDTQNLNNRQQSAVQNDQSFLQMDMANLSNRQQTELFKSQQTVQSLFTDQAATNAARQFNAQAFMQAQQANTALGRQYLEDVARFVDSADKERISKKRNVKNAINQMITNAGNAQLFNQMFPQAAYDPWSYSLYMKPGSGRSSAEVFGPGSSSGSSNTGSIINQIESQLNNLGLNDEQKKVYREGLLKYYMSPTTSSRKGVMNPALFNLMSMSGAGAANPAFMQQMLNLPMEAKTGREPR